MKYLLIFFLLFSFKVNAQYAGTYASANVDKNANQYIDSSGLTGSVNGRTYRFIFTRFAKDNKGYANSIYTVSDCWDSLTGVYPLAGGTLLKASWNFKDPTTYKLTFFNSPTVKDSGVIWNGVDQYASTGISFFSGQKTYNLSYYSITNNNVAAQDMGYFQNSPPYSQLGMYISYTGGTSYFEFFNKEISYSNSSAVQALWLQTQNADNKYAYKNATQIGSNSTSGNGAVSGFPILLNVATTENTRPSTRGCGFAQVGGYLTSTQVTGLYNSIQALKQRLGVSVGTSITID